MIEFVNAATPTSQPATSMIGGFLPILLIVIFFWLIVMRPQQKKFKLHKQMINELKKGDKVITNSGIIGKIIKVDNNHFVIEISPEINVQFEKNSILSLYDDALNNSNNKKNIANKS